mmetsp:Transcript_21645/g.33307  ORF Transcript_21645/g.33307 Transcript_21645/m.33307 type:complete len:92 (+) Transcript_21645:1805-2080(+)
MTDGLKDYPHFTPIRKLTFIQRHQSGISEVGVMDEMGIVSAWSIIEVASHIGTDYDLNMNLGGKFKLSMIFSDNLLLYPNVVDFINIEDLN